MNAAAPISLVTEANRGIGRAAVRQLAGLRHMALLYARRPEDAGSAAASLAGRPARRPRTFPVRLLVFDQTADRSHTLRTLQESRSHVTPW